MEGSIFANYDSGPRAPAFYGMDTGAADRLVDFIDYQFYTPAFLYLWGRFKPYMLDDFLREINRDVAFMFRRFQFPIFAGLIDRGGDPGWNHTLWAAKKTDWPELENFLLSVAVYDNSAGKVYRTGSQYLSVVDPLWLETYKVITPDAPRLPIVCMGVDCNIARLGLNTDVNPPLASRFSPAERTKRFASLVLREDSPAPVLDEYTPLPAQPSTPVELVLRDIDSFSSAKQAEVADLVRRYRKEFHI